MARESIGGLLEHLRMIVAASGSSELPDRELLLRFVRQRDEAAFASLVQRHGPLVLTVCRRLLVQEQDAEDAFQATFVVLARKAASLEWQPSIRSWLYQVAHRISLDSRDRIRRRQKREKQIEEIPVAAPEPEPGWQEMRTLLDEEINRLPQRYRLPLVLCYLEGKTRDEAAEQLGWSEGSVKGRLERGRELLRRRLTRRGATLSTALLATLLAEVQGSAAVPPLLLVSSVKAALHLVAGQAGLVPAGVMALAGGWFQALTLARLKLAAVAVLLLGLTGAGVGITLQTRPASLPTPETPEARVATVSVPPAEVVVPLPPPDPPAVIPPPARVPEPADEEPPERIKPRPDLSGSLEAVEVDAGRFTLKVRRNRGEDPVNRTFELGRGTRVLIDGDKPGRLSDLAPGADVQVFLSSKTEKVLQVIAEGPVIRGEVHAVDPEGRWLTLSQGEEGIHTYAVLAPREGGRRETPGDHLKRMLGQSVQAKLSVDRKSILRFVSRQR